MIAAGFGRFISYFFGFVKRSEETVFGNHAFVLLLGVHNRHRTAFGGHIRENFLHGIVDADRIDLIDIGLIDRAVGLAAFQGLAQGIGRDHAQETMAGVQHDTVVA